MLTDVPQINQKNFKTLVRTAIRCGSNILVIGPSGGGKTIIANEACREEACRLIYINLAVLERTDFQGFPVISDDKKLVSYATPEYLPFADATTRDARNSLEALMTVVDRQENPAVAKFVDDKLADLKSKDAARVIRSAAPLLAGADKTVIKEMENVIKTMAADVKSDEAIVFLFDEVDKAATETTQTLLELLQFGSINGRKLNVKACILTGNLPDEHAHSSQISHAISKRCSTYRMDIDFGIWRDWAFKNGVHDHVIQFLSNEPGLIYKGVPDGDVTAYALPSPRTWVAAGEMLKVMDEDSFFDKMSDEQKLDLKFSVIAGNVGATAAAKFRTWFNHYRKWDHAINELVENGKNPDLSKASAQEHLIVAIAACSRVYSELKPKNDKRIADVTKHVYKWLASENYDVQHAAVRISFGGDFDTCHKYKLTGIGEFVAIFKGLKEKFKDYNSDLAG